jgi:hypothetical protein
MLKRRKNKKASKKVLHAIKRGMGTTILTCKVCDLEEVEVGLDTAAVTCAYCVQRMVAPPVLHNKTPKSDKPRGWHFKAYYEHEGIVYSKGVEVTDAEEISRLKKSFGKSLKPVAKKPAKNKSKSKRSTIISRGRKNDRSSK